MKAIDVTTAILLIVGGLNWGLVGFFNFDLVGALFGYGSGLSRVIYALVGISAIYEAFRMPSLLKRLPTDFRFSSPANTRV